MPGSPRPAPTRSSFRTPVEVHGENLTSVSEFTVAPGERVPFVLTWYPSHEPPPEPVDAEVALAETETYWREWAGVPERDGEDYSEAVQQSLLVLKALTYEPTGGIVAAPTTSLPEEIGGVRNWDYRYCWLRDASLTLLAMLSAGYRAEAAAWRGVAVARHRRRPGPDADHVRHRRRALAPRARDRLAARASSILARCASATPPRSRSSSTSTARCWTPPTRRSSTASRAPSSAGRCSKRLLERLEEGWREKDAGIWEVRGPNRAFHPLQGDGLGRVRPRRAHVRGVRPRRPGRALAASCATRSRPRCWPAAGASAKQAFTQSYGSDALDASLLQMPLVGFIAADDPRFVSTVEAIRRELSVDGLLLRYRSEDGVDGLPPGEGVFLACSFWLVEVLALQGKQDEARTCSSGCSGSRNDVGLFSEEYDPDRGPACSATFRRP